MGTHDFPILLIFLALSTFTFNFVSGEGNCTQNAANLWRLNGTRFFIMRTSNLSELTDWATAKERCVALGMKLATIDSVGEDAVVGRALENTIMKHPDFDRRNKFWLDGKYSEADGGYVWVDEQRPVNYTNILYEWRATGFGNDLNSKGDIYKPTGDSADLPEMCLSYGITYTLSGLQSNASYLGFETRMMETPCKFRPDKSWEKRFPMCEASSEDCPNLLDSHDMVFTDTKNYVIYEGNWIFGTGRRFVVNWNPRTKAEAKTYCEDRGMKLYRADFHDGCLIPYLALWNKRVTTSNFWTDIMYNLAEMEYKFTNGEIVAVGRPFANASSGPSDAGRAIARTDAENIEICVVSQYSYEAFGSNACECQWNSLVLAPANCNSKVATICTYMDKNNQTQTHESCGDIWGTGENVYDKLDSADGRQYVVDRTHTTAFGYKEHGDEINPFYRSTYKQRFGNRLCPTANELYQMATTKTVLPQPQDSMDYKYDTEEEYWVVDDEKGGVGATGNNCSTTKWDGKEWGIRAEVYCNDWHFYICVMNEIKHRSKRGIIESETVVPSNHLME